MVPEALLCCARMRSTNDCPEDHASEGRLLCKNVFLQHHKKGGDPAAPSSTATLLRLHPSH